ncbi:carboxypeptidase-like regulatory domain-containing protein [Flavobacterium sp. SM2513]|uniref:carboxypeptidase-like regulatory domain-containing protein n=1 Tax=Flavobacterium sp. SM2513 TaxID=3424766 RepID=UPI003D7F4BD8
MLQKIFLLLFVLSGFFLKAQTKGVVVDSLGMPIPYVSVFVENEDKTTTSEENGTFSIQVSAGAKLIFSALGYESKTVLASKASKVVLKQNIFDLDDVVIKKANKPKTLEIGRISHALLEAFDTGPKIEAKFFPYESTYRKTKWIKKIMLFTDSPIENASIKLHIYSVDENGFPGAELLTKDLIVNLKKGIYRHQFDVYDLDIEMPESGVFVAFEKMRIERNKIERKVTNSQTGIVRTDITYAPKVLCYMVKKPFAFSYSGGKWNRKINEEELGTPLQIYEPSLTLLLSN